MKFHSFAAGLLTLAPAAVKALLVYSNESIVNYPKGSPYEDHRYSSPENLCFLPVTASECRDTCSYYVQLKDSIKCSQVNIHYSWLEACLHCGKDSLLGTADEHLYTSARDSKNKCITKSYTVATCPKNEYPQLLMEYGGDREIGKCTPAGDRSSCLAACAHGFATIAQTSYYDVFMAYSRNEDTDKLDYCGWIACYNCYNDYKDLSYTMIPSLMKYIANAETEFNQRETENNARESSSWAHQNSGWIVYTDYVTDSKSSGEASSLGPTYTEPNSVEIDSSSDSTVNDDNDSSSATSDSEFSSVVESKYTEWVSEDCDICITTVITTTGVTTITKVIGGKTVTVTEPCETAITKVDDNKTVTVTEPCDGEVTSVEGGITVTVTEPCETTITTVVTPPSKPTVTVTEPCEECVTTTIVSSGYTTVTKVKEGKTVTVTEPCETTVTSVITPAPKTTIVTEPCEECITTTSVSSGYTTVTKVEEGKTVTVTEPCETTVTSVITPAPTTTTVTEPCDECTTELIVSSGYTTVTKVEEGKTVTVTEPCETTITQVVPTTTKSAVVSPPVVKSSTEAPAATTSAKQPPVGPGASNTTFPNKTSVSVQVPSGTGSAPTTIRQVNGGVVNTVSMAVVAIFAVSFVF